MLQLTPHIPSVFFITLELRDQKKFAEVFALNSCPCLHEHFCHNEDKNMGQSVGLWYFQEMGTD